MVSNQKLREIFDRTNGCCHFCGDKVVFEKYGVKNVLDSEGVWEADHVNQKAKGGTKDASNCLPACFNCNRLRWHRTGAEIRELIFLGLIAKDEIKKESTLGKEMQALKLVRERNNVRRRRSVLLDNHAVQDSNS